MKQYIKGIVTGFMAACILSAIPSLADTADMVFNSVRINVNGVDMIQWGEEITLDSGSTVPSSILYNGTTYLPLRKTSELLEKNVSWNDDTKTVSISPIINGKRPITTHPDKNGNLWEYYIFEDKGYYYLCVSDEKRDYERIYLMASDSVRVTDNEIYFIRPQQYDETKYHLFYAADLILLPFASDENTQDGESIHYFYNIKNNEAIFDGDYLFYTYDTATFHSTGVLVGLNYITGESDQIVQESSWHHYRDLYIKESNGTSTLLNYTHTTNSQYSYKEAVAFYKSTNTFGEVSER